VMCRHIARFITDDSAKHATRRMENVHAQVIRTQRHRRQTAFAHYREAISKRAAFFLPHLLLGEPMRMRFGNMWGMPPHLADISTPPVFVVTAHLSATCWECAVVTDVEFASTLQRLTVCPDEYQRLACLPEGQTMRRHVAQGCADLTSAMGRRCVHMKALPYGDGYRIRVYFVRVMQLQPHLLSVPVPGSSLALVRFMCLPRPFHIYPAYKRPKAQWKHKTEVLPKVPPRMYLRTAV
jgi:hypothetical protein